MGLFPCVSHLIYTHIHYTTHTVEREGEKKEARESLERVQPKLQEAIGSPSSLKRGKELALYVYIYMYMYGMYSLEKFWDFIFDAPRRVQICVGGLL